MRGGRFLIGDFLNVVIAFVTIAIALFVFVVKPANALTSRMRGRTPPREIAAGAVPYFGGTGGFALEHCL